MPLYDVIMGYVQDDFEKRGIDFEVPDYKSVKSIKTVLKDMMIAFSEKYPDKGYLIIVGILPRIRRDVFQVLSACHVWYAGEDFRQSAL